MVRHLTDPQAGLRGRVGKVNAGGSRRDGDAHPASAGDKLPGRQSVAGRDAGRRMPVLPGGRLRLSPDQFFALSCQYADRSAIAVHAQPAAAGCA